MMPAAPAIIAAGASIYSASQANKQAGDLASMQKAAYDRDLSMREGYRRQQELLYGPLERQMVQDASSPLPLGYGQMKGAIDRNYDASGRTLSSNLASRGLAGSNVEKATRGGLELGRAGALSNAFQQGLQNRLELAKGVLSRFQPGANVDRVSGGLGQLGGFFGQQAGQFGQAAQQGYSAAGQGLGSLGQYLQTQSYLDSINKQPEAPAVTPISQDTIQPLPTGGGFDFSGGFGLTPQAPSAFGQPTSTPGLWDLGGGAATNTTSVQ